MDTDKEQYCCDGSCPDDIIITGMAGRFPNCDDVETFNDALLKQTNLFTPIENRWEPGVCNTVVRECGLLNDIKGFDGKLFHLPMSTIESMDPEQRIILEVSYEAICDSGYDPKELRGHNIGVYCCSVNTDSMGVGFREISENSFCCEFMRANRVSYWFDFKGPSYCLDSACASSGVALHNAINDIRLGLCEAALVNGVQIVLDPAEQLNYEKLGIISNTSTCLPFDSRANGSVRSEAVAAFFIQKASAARRNYATILAGRAIAAGYSLRGISVPSKHSQVALFNSLMRESNLTPNDISFVECHGTGTLVGDPIEVKSVERAFCHNRKEPLLIGSVKSSIGHSEAVSGVCSVIKMLLAFQSGVITPHFSFKTPNSECTALINGSIKVITEPTPMKGNYVGVNCFGFGGCLSHVILRRNQRKQSQQTSYLPMLVLMCATCEEGLKYALDYIQQRALGREFFALLQKLAFRDPAALTHRGYAIVGTDLPSEMKVCVQEKKSVWFVMTGMGCQWPGMGTDLMAIETFSRSIHKSAKTLQPYGIDLLEIIKPGTNHLMQIRRITPAFVSICAIQIALIDVLKEVGLVPDGIVGHSAGELACAYADGCCTAEQTILSAYWRGRSVELANLPDGGMAAVGMTWEDAKKRCPKDVFPACHNAEDSITISGLKKPLEDFVSQLKKENVFSCVVDTYGFAFHCCLLAPAAPILRSNLVKVITDPKPRTPCWVSTSYPPEEWSKPEAHIANGDYFVNNLMSNVHFADALAYIPKDAIVIEIGPHTLLQPLLKRAVGNKATYLGLMKRHENNVNILLNTLGQLYTLGLDPKIERLYPPITYPVSESTASISSILKWDHSKEHTVAYYSKKSQGCLEISIDTTDEDKYILDHLIDGRSLYPAAGYLYLAWQALAAQLNKPFDQLPIVIEDFKIHRASILSLRENKKYNVSILNAGGEFEITEGTSIISTGKIVTSPDFVLPTPSYNVESSNVVTGREVYNEMRVSGYEYGPNFQCLAEMSIDGSQGLLTWTDKWIPYLDAHLLFFCNSQESDEFRLPTGAISVKINPFETKKFLQENGNLFVQMPVNFNKSTACCLSPGVEIRSLKLESASHSSSAIKDAVLDKVAFVPNVVASSLSNSDLEIYNQYLDVCNQLIKNTSLSNCTETSNKVNEYLSCGNKQHVLLNTLQKALQVQTGSDYIKNLKDVFEKYVADAHEDLLYKMLFNEYPLAYLIATVIENSRNRLAVAEVTSNRSTVLPFVEELIKRQTTIKPSFTLFHSQPEILQSDALSTTNINVQKFEYFREPKVAANQDLVIGSIMFGNEQNLQESVHFLASLVKPMGFLLLFHRESLSAPEEFLSTLCNEKFSIQSHANIRKAFVREKLTIICKKSDSFGSTIYLLRLLDDSKKYIDSVVHVKDGHYKEWVDELKQSFVKASEDENVRIWIVAEDSPFNGIIGMVKCLKKELGGENIRCVFMMGDATTNCLPKFSLTDPFFSLVVQNNLLLNVYKNGSWGSYHSTRVPADPDVKLVDHSCLTINKCGDLSTFQWIEAPIKQLQASIKDHQLIHVCYSALNFRDVMEVTGKLIASRKMSFNKYLIGYEYAGITSDGCRVMGYTENAGFSSEIYKHPDTMFMVPDHWTLEEAATVPVVYSTCYFALIMTARLKDHESILIHSGAGGIGIAAIRIALSLNCNIFVTVGTKEKRLYLLKTFPQLNGQQIGYSRDTSFKDLILERTNGKGVDVVLNSLADDKLIASIRCVAQFGRFIEIGKYDLALDRKIGLGFFLKNTSFHAVHLDILLDERISQSSNYQTLMELLVDGIEKGVIQPLDRTVFSREEVEKAIRYMSHGKHIGKVLVKVRDEPKKGFLPSPLDTQVLPYTYFYKTKSYIVIGGLGGFGIELVKWLLLYGAHNIIITSRSGITTGYHRMCMLRWKKSGHNVIVSLLNVSKKQEAEQLLREAKAIAPIGGIFNSALVLKDDFLENQNYRSFEEVCAPKAEATKNLDKLTRTMCSQLDYFVCFSSMIGEKGNAGQSNYGFANSVMERVCERRRQDGLHGLAVQWGIVGDVGMVYRHMGEDATINGLVPQRVKSCLDVLSRFLQRKEAVLSSYTLLDESKTKNAPDNFLDLLIKVIGYKDVKEINLSQTLADLGIDSLAGIEIQQILQLQYDIHMNMQDLQKLSIKEVVALTDSLKTTSTTSSFQPGQFTFPENFGQEKKVLLLKEGIPGTLIFVVGHSGHELQELRSLVTLLDATVYGLVCATDTPIDSLTSIAEAYVQEIIALCEYKSIQLIGYRSSASLALQIANHLHRDCQKGPKLDKLTILDGSLELVNNLSTGGDSSKELEVTNLCDFLSQFTKADLTKVRKDLASKEDSDTRITYVVDLMAQVQVKLDKAAIIDVVRRYLSLRDVFRKLEVTEKLTNSINIIEASGKLLSNDVATVQSILSKITSGKIIVNRVPSDNLSSDFMNATAKLLKK